MRLTVKATNLTLTNELRSYAVEKLTSLERFFPNAEPDAIIVDIELAKPSRHHQKGDIYRCEVNLAMGKILLRAEERGESIMEAIDKVRDEIEREVRKLKTRRQTRLLRTARAVAERLKLTRFLER